MLILMVFLPMIAALVCYPICRNSERAWFTPSIVISGAVFNRINQERKASGRSNLRYAFEIQDQANLRAAECAKLLSHTRPNRTSYTTVLAGVSYSTAGENVGCLTRNRTATHMMDSWMSVPASRAQVVSSSYDSVAVGTYVDPSTGNLYVVTLFLG